MLTLSLTTPLRKYPAALRDGSRSSCATSSNDLYFTPSVTNTASSSGRSSFTRLRRRCTISQILNTPALSLPLAPSKTTTTNADTDIHVEMNVNANANMLRQADAECWSRMLMLQRKYRCYNSARVEAAVDALERGCKLEDVGIPSRLCLNLLNEGLNTQIAAVLGCD